MRSFVVWALEFRARHWGDPACWRPCTGEGEAARSIAVAGGHGTVETGGESFQEVVVC